jgi:hypothetical protein
MKITSKWTQVTRDRCYSGGCPDQLCAGGVEWDEARRFREKVFIRTIWSNDSTWCANEPRIATADEIDGFERGSHA